MVGSCIPGATGEICLLEQLILPLWKFSLEQHWWAYIVPVPQEGGLVGLSAISVLPFESGSVWCCPRVFWRSNSSCSRCFYQMGAFESTSRRIWVAWDEDPDCELPLGFIFTDTYHSELKHVIRCSLIWLDWLVGRLLHPQQWLLSFVGSPLPSTSGVSFLWLCTITTNMWL